MFNANENQSYSANCIDPDVLRFTESDSERGCVLLNDVSSFECFESWRKRGEKDR